MLRRQELFLTAARHSCATSDFTREVQSQVLPKFGFRGDLKGVSDMLDHLACCVDRPEPHLQEAFNRPEVQGNHEIQRLGCLGKLSRRLERFQTEGCLIDS